MDEFERYYAKALKFLGYRPRSEKEVVDNLTRKKAPHHIIQLVIAKLKEQRFLNDDEFARMWVKSRKTQKSLSQKAVRQELLRKGIEKEIIESTLSNSTEEHGSDLEIAKKAIERKVGRYKGLPREKVYQKLSSFLARRGFDWDTIREAIDHVYETGRG